MGEAEFAEQVEAFLHEYATPKRRREPRTAAVLASVPIQRIPFPPHGSLAAWRFGDGPAVLLVHGFEDDNSVWDPMAAELARLGRSFVAFDAPGHGGSDGHWGLGWDFTDGIHAVVDALGPIDAVVAHSVSVPATIGAMREGFGPRRCVFIAPPFRSGGDRWNRYREKLQVSEEVAAAARLRHEEVIGPERTNFDTALEFSRLTVPVLVVHSSDDERMPVEDSKRCVPSCPTAELLLVADLGHRKTARDQAVVKEVGAFLGDQDQPPSTRQVPRSPWPSRSRAAYPGNQ